MDSSSGGSYGIPQKRLRLMCSLRKSSAGPSLPQSLTTTEEHRTTFLSLPSASSLQRPAYFPNCMLSAH